MLYYAHLRNLTPFDTSSWRAVALISRRSAASCYTNSAPRPCRFLRSKKTWTHPRPCWFEACTSVYYTIYNYIYIYIHIIYIHLHFIAWLHGDGKMIKTCFAWNIILEYLRCVNTRGFHVLAYGWTSLSSYISLTRAQRGFDSAHWGVDWALGNPYRLPR